MLKVSVLLLINANANLPPLFIYSALNTQQQSLLDITRAVQF